MFTIPQSVIAVLEAIFIILGAYFVLFWVGLVVWTFQDIRHRSHDWLVQILSVLLVLAFHVAGLVVYLILRPQETLATVYSRTLEAEALLQAMEEKLACPHCHRQVKDEFAACPYCGETLKQTCAACGRLLALNWSVCPYCPTAVDGNQAAEEPIIGSTRLAESSDRPIEDREPVAEMSGESESEEDALPSTSPPTQPPSEAS